jgi:hypothetical protein
MGNTQSIRKINYEDMQMVSRNPEIYLIINTLSQNEQNCLIINTTDILKEEEIINKFIKTNKGIRIVIYGKNSNDDNVQKKYQQLTALGFYNVFVYNGGMFEWLMLQDIFGTDMFQTNKKEIDFLKYKPQEILNISLLEN